jgi:universal stress protein F
VFKKILYPIDIEPGDASQHALPDVAEMARQWKAELYILYVLPGFGMPIVASFFPPDAEQKMVAKAREMLDEFCKEHVHEDIPVTPFVAEGTPYEEILRESAQLGVDLIVIPERGRAKTAHLLLGSTANKVVQHAGCAVLVLREPRP